MNVLQPSTRRKPRRNVELTDTPQPVPIRQARGLIRKARRPCPRYGAWHRPPERPTVGGDTGEG
jgi:hypothetical protein